MNYDYDKEGCFLHLVVEISSLNSDFRDPREHCALLGVSNVPRHLQRVKWKNVKDSHEFPVSCEMQYWNQRQHQQPTYSWTMTLIRNVLDSRLYPQHWLHLPFFALTHTKLSSHWTTATQSPPKNTSKSKFILCQIYPMISHVFPVVFPIIFPTRISCFGAAAAPGWPWRSCAATRICCRYSSGSSRRRQICGAPRGRSRTRTLGSAGLDFFLVNILWYIYELYIYEL